MPSRRLRAVVEAARLGLAEAGVASPEHDALALAAHALGTDEGEVRRRIALGEPADAVFLDAYLGLVAERAARIPLQHLTGRAAFRHLELEVGPGVFVPRPETETVAGLAIGAARRVLAGGRAPVVVDLCSGSGAIALAVKDEVPEAAVAGVELSELALAWATRNRDRLGLDVELLLGDATSALPGREGQVDVVVANPPYIPLGSVPVDPEVRDHDPELALYGGSADGLAIPAAVARRAADLLRPGGTLVIEHADTQGERLVRLLVRSGQWAGVEDRPDLGGRPRAVVAGRAADGAGARPAPGGGIP